MATVARIHHAAIRVDPERVEETIEFYRDIMQFPELNVPYALSHIPIVAWFRLGECELHLIVDSGTSDMERPHICFEVDELTPFKDRLRDANIPHAPGDPIPGRPRVFTHDPSGNRIEFMIDETRQ